MSKRVYLAGAMSGLSDNGGGWRDIYYQFFRGLGWEVSDPRELNTEHYAMLVGGYRFIVEDFAVKNNKSYSEPSDLIKILRFMRDSNYNEAYFKIMKQIINDDLKLIRNSNVLFVYLDKAALSSAGTLGEITYAYSNDIDVALVLVDLEKKDVPDWVLGCASMLAPSLEKAKEFFTLLVS